MKFAKDEIRQAWFDLAHEMEKECGDWQNGSGLSPEKKAALLAEVERREAAKEQRGKSGKVVAEDMPHSV